MLSIPSQMQASLDAGATTHCWCWHVTRRDGQIFGFTEHDRDLEIDGIGYLSGSGFGGAGQEVEAWLAPQQGEVAGALDAVTLRAADLDAGLWSGARVETWRVDWLDVALRVRTAVAEIGEIRRKDGRFEAELLGLAHALGSVSGRVFSRDCDAELGDERCGLTPAHPAFGLGCDQRFATCRERFANTLSFRGFPYMIGNDVLQASPASESVRDGRSRGIAS
jgi:hypothetical protein